MTPLWIALVSASMVVVYDAIASAISLTWKIPYRKFTAGSWLIYGFAGAVVARWHMPHGVILAVLAGGTAGLSDATLGWAISWWIGPGRIPRGLTLSLWAKIAWKVTSWATTIAIAANVITEAATRFL